MTSDADRPSYVAVEFDQPASLQTVYNALSALIDLALTQQGASVAQLDLSDLAVRELLKVLHSNSASVVSAELRPAPQRLIIDTAGRPIVVTDASTEILSLGFGDVHLEGHSLTCRLINGNSAA